MAVYQSNAFAIIVVAFRAAAPLRPFGLRRIDRRAADRIKVFNAFLSGPANMQVAPPSSVARSDSGSINVRFLHTCRPKLDQAWHELTRLAPSPRRIFECP